jgi:small-conductance mechanosensitive channel
VLLAAWLLTGPAWAEVPGSLNVSSARLHDKVVFSLPHAPGQHESEERTQAASKALQQAIKAGSSATRIHKDADSLVVFAGEIPIIQLLPEDAALQGDASLDVLASRVAAAVHEGLEDELRRVRIADWVFSFSLVVFIGLVTLYLLRKSSGLFSKVRFWLEQKPEGVSALSVQSVELLSAATLRSLLLLALSSGTWIARGLLVYTYLLVTSSMFEATRGYAEKLGGVLLSPVSVMMTRLASSVPGLVILLFMLALLALVLRFIRLFFEEVARGRTDFAGLPRELAHATSAAVRVFVVLLALFLAPLITGSDSGALVELGRALLLGGVLAAVPLLCSGLLGAQLIFERRVREGDSVSLGELAGVVERVGFLSLDLSLHDGRRARVPHLLRLGRALVIHVAASSRSTLELRHWVQTLPVASSLPQRQVRELLIATLAAHGQGASARLVSAGPTQVLYELSLVPGAECVEDELLFTLICALQELRPGDPA